MNNASKLATYMGISVLALLAFLTLPKNTNRSIVEFQQKKPTQIDSFSELTISAKAAIVYDVANQKILFEKNSDAVLPLASLTKIMTAITAASIAPTFTTVTVNASSLSQQGDSGLYGNENWSLGNLLKYTLVVSSNDGAAAVANSIGALAKHENIEENTGAFVEEMNQKAKELGLRSMRFNNASGLDEDTTNAGGYGSARDTAGLLTYAVNHMHSIIEPTRYSTFEIASNDNVVHKGQNTDILAATIPGLIAGKTGYSDLAGGNLAIVFDAGIQHPITVVVLGSTYDGRFEDINKLVKASIDAIVAEQ